MSDYSRCDGRIASQKSLCGVRARGEQALRDKAPIRIAPRLPQRDQRLQQLGNAIRRCGCERGGNLSSGRGSAQRNERGADGLGLLGHAAGPGKEGVCFEGDFVDGGVFLDQGVLRET